MNTNEIAEKWAKYVSLGIEVACKPEFKHKVLPLLTDVCHSAIAEATQEKDAEIVKLKKKLGWLRTLGAVDYPRAGEAKASDLLFPEALS